VQHFGSIGENFPLATWLLLAGHTAMSVGIFRSPTFSITYPDDFIS